MKYKLTIASYSILIINIIAIPIVMVKLDLLAGAMMVLPCCMIWLHADRIRLRQKFQYKINSRKD